ncbi:MAG: glycoside hydrolase family 78 protein, partial [Marinilabiliales bacterium]|nr:glycoside hydrolase family 78 protein [Marinilabiliales bacterium]
MARLRYLLIFSILYILCTYPSFALPEGRIKPVGLKCEHLDQPLGIDQLHPQLSWQLTSVWPDQRQTAYQILVADQLTSLDRDLGNCWNSGKVSATQHANIGYQGKDLASGMKLFWKVRVWDGLDQPSAWSTPSTWEMGKLNPGDWQAKWIGTGEDQFPDSTLTFPAPWFRKTFRNSENIASARLYVSGLGFYELFLNGQRVGDHMLAPAQSNYDQRPLKHLIYYHDDQSRQRVYYNVFDVTQLLRKGRNAIGVVLGNGWYNQRDRTAEGWMWYNLPRMICQLEMIDHQGNRQIVSSDESWRMTQAGPLRHDGIFTGVVYDARMEMPGWSDTGYNDRNWQQARLVKAPTGRLQAQLAPVDRTVRTLQPTRMEGTTTGKWLFDAGEMISGWVQLRVHGQKGDTVRVRHIEELGRDYHQIDLYILKGKGEELLEPMFTWHAFRQIEVTGLKYMPLGHDLLVKVIHSDVAEAGTFRCSNPLFNQIFENYKRTQLGNLHGSISSDCPHRERLGYTGDGQVAIESAILTFDMAAFYRKWLADMEDARNHVTGYVPHTAPFGGGGGGPAWGSGYVIMNWACYQYYGDKNLLADHYEGMKKWVEYLGTRCDSAGIVVREEPKGWCLGDWATPEKIKLSPELVNTCYYYRSTDLLERIAGLLGKKEDQKRFGKLKNRIGKQLNDRFYDPRTGDYLDGKQGANLFPLAFGMVPEQEKQKVFEAVLRQLERTHDHFDTGILATPLLLDVLTTFGKPDLACRVMDQRDFPSYGQYILDKKATTLWENWDGGSSHSHPMYGSVVAWLFRTVAGLGIDPERPGENAYLIRPFLGGDLTWASASHETQSGILTVDWKKEASEYSVELNVPVNCPVTLELPVRHPIYLLENGKP